MKSSWVVIEISVQYESFSADSWHPGSEVYDAWAALLICIGAGHGGELDEHTFRRAGITRGGEQWWIPETLDFAWVGCDQLRHARRQQIVDIARDQPHPSASDHLPVVLTCCMVEPERAAAVAKPQGAPPDARLACLR